MQCFAIIPAAGRSRRMGRPKLLMPWRGATVIEHVLVAWRASKVDHVIAVVHQDDADLAELCARGAAHVHRPNPPPAEMKDSIRFGLELAAQSLGAQNDDAWLVAPADMPGLSSGTIDRLIEAYTASLAKQREPTIFVPRHGTRNGHPVLFPWSLAGEVAHLPAGQGLRALLDRHPVKYVEVDLADLGQDFDTPEEYERLRGESGP